MVDFIGDRVKEAIKGADLTQKQVALAINVSPQSVTKWIKDGKISRENVIALSKATGYTYTWLSTGQGPRLHYHANSLYHLLAQSDLTHTALMQMLDIQPRTLVQQAIECEQDELPALVDQVVQIAGFDEDILRRSIFQMGVDEMPNIRAEYSDDNVYSGPIPLAGVLESDNDTGTYTLKEMNRGHVNARLPDASAYCLVIRGDSLSPSINNGWLIAIEPHAEPQPGEYVLVKTSSGQFMICELLYQRRDEISICCINNYNKRRFISTNEVDYIRQVGMILPPSKLVDDTLNR
jgi:phage repressor protein C with HTH and peptisase S24 domain